MLRVLIRIIRLKTYYATDSDMDSHFQFIGMTLASFRREWYTELGYSYAIAINEIVQERRPLYGNEEAANRG